MAEWNPITGFVGKGLTAAFAIMLTGLSALAGYGWHVTESNGMGLGFALLLFGAALFAAQYYDVSRHNTGRPPYLTHLVMSAAAVFFGVLYAVQINSGTLNLFVLLLGLIGALSFAVLAGMSLKGTDVYRHNWKAPLFVLPMFMFFCLNGAKISDEEGRVKEFLYRDTPIMLVVAVALLLFIRPILKQQEIKYKVTKG